MNVNAGPARFLVLLWSDSESQGAEGSRMELRKWEGQRFGFRGSGQRLSRLQQDFLHISSCYWVCTAFQQDFFRPCVTAPHWLSQTPSVRPLSHQLFFSEFCLSNSFILN